MGIWSWLPWGRKNADPTERQAWLRGGLPTGAPMTPEAALSTTTVLACCRVLMNGVAQVPFRLYQEANDRRKPASEHPLYPLLYRRPNKWQTAFEFRQTLVLHLALTWNAFVFVNRVGLARNIFELIIIEPQRVTVERRDDLSLVYRVTGERGEQQVFAADAIWHLRGPSWNSYLGMNPLRLAAEAIGLAAALERGQAEFQKSGAVVSGSYSVEEKLSPERYEFLAKWIDRHSVGGDRAAKPLILDMGAEWASHAMSSVDQQLIETRKFQIEEICRAFNIMPIMVGHGGDTSPTYASAEQFFLAHVVHTLSPWYELIEQSADVNLLTEEERRAGYYTKFTPNALMRGAANDRANFYSKGLGAGGTKGWLTQNDVRRLEDMDPSDDPKADELPQPTAKPGTPPADPSNTPGDPNAQ